MMDAVSCLLPQQDARSIQITELTSKLKKA